MRTGVPIRRRGRVAALTLAVAMACSAGSAFAQDDEEDVPLDTKIIRNFLKDLGLRNGNSEDVEYRERAPLVVPPSRNLPPPQAEGSAERNPAWPHDPDVKRRKQAAAAEKAKLRGAGSVEEDARVLRPDELNPGGRPRGGTRSAGSNGAAAGADAGQAGRPMAPSELGSKSIFGSLFSSFGPGKPESAPFTGEPPRTSMTEPPPGYQTPSPSFPYGIAPEKKVSKPSTLEERVEGR